MADEEHIQASINRGSSTDIQAGRPSRLGPAASATPEDIAAAHPPKDSLREIVETVVFVIVLVLLLKTFVAEAFVIPTGSMATTLLGHHIDVTCPKCGFHFTVNASSEVEDPETHQQRVTGCECQNCRYKIKGSDFGRSQGK